MHPAKLLPCTARLGEIKAPYVIVGAAEQMITVEAVFAASHEKKYAIGIGSVRRARPSRPARPSKANWQ
jgi:hypothetical protein